MSEQGGPTRVGTVLPQVLEKHGVRERIERLSVLEDWEAVVGRQLAKVTSVRGLDERALVVEVRSSAWLMELSLMKEDFLERVNHRLTEAPVEKLVFVLAETT